MTEISKAVQEGMRARVRKLQAAVRQLPQWEPVTQHYFADQMYCRIVPRPAGALIVGKVHRKEHFYIVLTGTVIITNGEEEAREVTGPQVIVSPIGTKRAVYAKTAAVCGTVHRLTGEFSSEEHIAQIEDEITEPDPDSAYLPGNILKNGLLR
jgi:hypothetical protein